jgi:septal ring factor EnvC (AmiA/AmiB activator)
MASRSSEGRHSTQNTRNPQKIGFSAISAISALIVVIAVAIAAAQAPDRARTEALARRATERLQALQREADRLASQETTLLGDLRRLEIERQLRAEELRRLDTDAKAVEAELATTSERMRSLETAQHQSQPQLRARLVEIYKLGEARYLRLILSTPDLRRLGQSTRTVAVLAKLDRDRVASHQQTLAALKSGRRTLEERGSQLTTLKASAGKAQAAAGRAARARADLVRDIDRRRDLNAQLAGELQDAQQKMQAMLRGMVAGGPAVELISLPLRPFQGELPWPVEGELKRRFNLGSASNGIEIAAAPGAEARAIHDGVVAFSGSFAGFGNLVILDHGSETFSLYGDLLESSVAKGVRVEQGRRVGLIGPSRSGSDGLYFELRVDGQPVDPLQWLKKR